MTKKILFLGTHGQHNIGDELLLETFLCQLGSNHRYVVNSYDPEFTATQLGDRYDVDVIQTNGDRIALLRHLFKADRIVFGGGSILKELYKTTGRNRYATLLMVLAIVTFARQIARKPIAMLNIGVGPITTDIGRRLVRAIVTQVDEIVVRDPGSYAVCIQSGIDPRHVRIGTDAVFAATESELLGGPQAATNDTAVRIESSQNIRIGLNLNFDIANPDNWELFQCELAKAIEVVAAEVPIELVAIPMQSKFKSNDDASVLRAFAERLSAVEMIHTDLVTTADAARLIATCDVVVSERFHTIVMASILGVPTFALAYDVKVLELARMLGLEDMSVDINQPFEGSAIAEPLLRLISRRTQHSATLTHKVETLAEQARRNFALARAWIEDNPTSGAESFAEHAAPTSHDLRSRVPARVSQRLSTISSSPESDRSRRYRVIDSPKERNNDVIRIVFAMEK